MEESKYDVIIIGGGLSGCTLGYLLRKQNKKVLIIERQKLKNKNKLCGGLLTNRAFLLLQKIYGMKDVERLGVCSYKKAFIQNKNDIFQIDNIKIHSVYRKHLDDSVLKNYLKVGGDILENTTYDSLDIFKQSLVVGGKFYKYEKLVGADGIHSQLRKDLTGRIQNCNFALEIYTKEIKSKNVKICFFDEMKSYGWIIPNKEVVSVGIGEVTGKTKIDKGFNQYLSMIGIKPKNKKGAFLPTGNDILLTKYKNVYFIGDSAGLISPITGEGIYSALYSAKVLSENMNKDYVEKMKLITNQIKKELIFKKFVYNNFARNHLFSRYKSNIRIKGLVNKFANFILK